MTSHEEVLAWVAERLRSNDLGVSSKALLAYALDGGPIVDRYGRAARPHDEADLGRCERLFAAAPPAMRVRMRPTLEQWRQDVLGGSV